VNLLGAVVAPDDRQRGALEALTSRDETQLREYTEAHAALKRAAEAAAARCLEACVERGVGLESCVPRVKDWDHGVLPKLQDGRANPWDKCGDLIGVRIVVLSLLDVRHVHSAVAHLCRETTVDAHRWYTTSAKARGYEALHMQLCLPDDCGIPANTIAAGAELQIVTAIQNTWGDLTHADFYKPEEGAPLEMSQRVLRLAAVMNLVDEELQAIRTGLKPAIEARVDEVRAYARAAGTRVVLDELSLLACAGGPLRDAFVGLRDLGRRANFEVSGWPELVRLGPETNEFLHFAADAGIGTVGQLREACDRALNQSEELKLVPGKLRDGSELIFDRPLKVLQAAEMLRIGYETRIRSPFRKEVTSAIHAVILEL